MGHLLDMEQKVMALGADLGNIFLEEELTRIARSASRAR
jgi:hypothetical protein